MMLRVAALALAANLCSAMPVAGGQKRAVHRVTPASEVELKALVDMGIEAVL